MYKTLSLNHLDFPPVDGTAVASKVLISLDRQKNTGNRPF